MLSSRLYPVTALFAAAALVSCASDPLSDAEDAGAQSPTGGDAGPAGGAAPPPAGGVTPPPSGGAEAPADPAEIDAFWNALFGVICSKGASCCPDDPNFKPGGLCASFTVLISGGAKDDVAQGYARFVPSATAGCLSAARALVEGAGCDADIISLLTEFFTIGECSAVFPPDQRQGEPCTKDVGQCVTGLVCASGVCAPPIATGGPCTPMMSGAGCTPTTVCSPASRTCVERVGEGDACAAPEECVSGACEGGRCGPLPMIGFCGN